MGVLTDLVSLGDRDPQHVLSSDVEAPTFQSKGIGIVELSQLGELLGAGDSIELSRQFDLIAGEEDEGPWLLTIPEALLSSLQTAMDGTLESVAPKWARIEEFGGHAEVDVLMDYLKGARAFLTENEGPFALSICL